MANSRQHLDATLFLHGDIHTIVDVDGDDVTFKIGDFGDARVVAFCMDDAAVQSIRAMCQEFLDKTGSASVRCEKVGQEVKGVA